MGPLCRHKLTGLFELQLLHKTFHVQNMLGLRLSKGGVLRIMTVSFQIDYQRFLPSDVSLAL
jgi:hypothetical protein